jgi:hypothetical protein
MSEDTSRDQQREVTEAWQQYDVGFHLLVATFNDDGQALMYLIARMEDSRAWVHRLFFPGIATIGLGAHAANFWLNYRRQVWGCSVRQSAYHAYEAERLTTEPSSDVNMELVIATKEKTFHLTHDVPELDGCPVSFSELEKMFSKYGPRDTNDLGHPKSLTPASGKSKQTKVSAS